jgi:hypothetical protein
LPDCGPTCHFDDADNGVAENEPAVPDAPADNTNTDPPPDGPDGDTLDGLDGVDDDVDDDATGIATGSVIVNRPADKSFVDATGDDEPQLKFTNTHAGYRNTCKRVSHSPPYARRNAE